MKVWIKYVCCDRYLFEGKPLYTYALKYKQGDEEHFYSCQSYKRRQILEELEPGTYISLAQLEEIKEE